MKALATAIAAMITIAMVQTVLVLVAIAMVMIVVVDTQAAAIDTQVAAAEVLGGDMIAMALAVIPVLLPTIRLHPIILDLTTQAIQDHRIATTAITPTLIHPIDLITTQAQRHS